MIQRLVVLSTLLVLAACGEGAPPNVVLVTLDTTRADHLGPYGHAEARTPALDRFARSAVVYERAYASSSWTLPSHATLFTGLLPMQHGAQTAPDGPSKELGYGVRPLAERFETLAERLRAAGYRTAGAIGGPALVRELGMAQGFEFYEADFTNPAVQFNGKRAATVADEAIAFVERFGEEPFFLFVNFFDPHSPYDPPPPFDRDLPPFDDGPLTLAFVERLRGNDPTDPVGSLPPSDREILDSMRAGYDAEIAYMDHHLGRLLDALAAAPHGDRTFIAITGDHGESFGEHWFLSHGAHLYEDNVRVPLLVRHPDGRGAGTRVAAPTDNRRVFRMALEAARLPAPAAKDDAPIVLEVRRSENNVSLFGPFFDRDLRAIVEHPFKLIEDSRGRVELFDLSRDGEELADLAESDSATRERLARRLRDVEASHPPLYETDARAELSPENAEALRALGYLD